jgi:hypothetical protein
VGRLGLDEELVNLETAVSREEAEVDTHLDEGKEVERLLGGNGMGMAEDPVGATDLVEQGLCPLLE